MHGMHNTGMQRERARQTGQQGLAIAEGAYIPPTPFKISNKRFEKKGCGRMVGGEGGGRMNALKLYVFIPTNPAPPPQKAARAFRAGFYLRAQEQQGFILDLLKTDSFSCPFLPFSSLFNQGRRGGRGEGLGKGRKGVRWSVFESGVLGGGS